MGEVRGIFVLRGCAGGGGGGGILRRTFLGGFGGGWVGGRDCLVVLEGWVEDGLFVGLDFYWDRRIGEGVCFEC